MLVKNKHLTTIWYEEETDKVKIIDQRLIPFKLTRVMTQKALKLIQTKKTGFFAKLGSIK